VAWRSSSGQKREMFLFVTVLLSVTSSFGCCYIFMDVGFSGLFITAAVEAMTEEQRRKLIFIEDPT